eukprot:5956409-Pleurochrysis_carterae.AAC.1
MRHKKGLPGTSVYVVRLCAGPAESVSQPGLSPCGLEATARCTANDTHQSARRKLFQLLDDACRPCF